MKDEIIKDTISYLNDYLDNIIKEYNIVLKAKKQIEEKGYEYVAVHSNKPIHDVSVVLVNNGYTGFMKTSKTHNEYCTLMTGKPLALFGKIIKKFVNKSLSYVKMKGNQILDAESYCILMQYLCANKSTLESIDLSNKNLSKNKKYNISKTNYVEELINSPIKQFCNIMNTYIVRYGKIIEILKEIKTLLVKIDKLDFESDYDLLIGYCNELFAKISSLNFQNKRLSSLKIFLKNRLKTYKKEEKIKKEPVPEFTKLGTKSERIKKYEENKKIERLNILKGMLTSDSKLWVSILLEQLKEIDISNFSNSPYEYIPMEEEQLDLILDVVETELSFGEANDEILKIIEEVKRK